VHRSRLARAGLAGGGPRGHPTVTQLSRGWNRGPAHRARCSAPAPPAQDHDLRLPGRRLLPGGQERHGPRRSGRPGTALAHRLRLQRLLRAARERFDRARARPRVGSPPSTPTSWGLRRIPTSSRPAHTSAPGPGPAQSRLAATVSRTTSMAPTTIPIASFASCAARSGMEVFAI
jgi:hypothetical protein